MKLSRDKIKQQFNFTSSSFRTIIIFLLLSLIGVSLIPKLSIQPSSSRSYPSVSISCSMPSTSAETMELEVTALIESTLARLPGIREISSTSRSGYCFIYIALDKWTDPEKFRFEAASILRQLYQELPPAASYPLINVNRPGDDKTSNSLISYTVYGAENVGNIASFVNNYLRPSLVAIKGVNRITIEGAQPEQIAIQTTQSSLSALRNTTNIADHSLAETLTLGLRSTNLGIYRQGNTKMAVAMENNLDQIGAFANYPITSIRDRIIRLKSVSISGIEKTPPNRYVRTNGQEKISLNIYPEKHINTLQLTKQIRSKMAALEARFPKGYQLALAYDSTEQIQEELHKIYIRTILSLFILLCFVLLITRRINYITIVFSSLLVNILLAFVCYYLFGLEIHLYSIAGITLSLGLVVDNAIIIVEDLRHSGRNRIFPAILASTLTAAGALSIVFLLKENQRLLLIDFVQAIVINLLISLPVAYFFIPAMLQRLPVDIVSKQTKFKRKKQLLQLTNLYCKQLRLMLRFRKSLILCFLLAFGLPLFLLPKEIDGDNTWVNIYNATIGSEFYNSKLREPLNRYLGGSLFLFAGSQSGTNRSGIDPDARTELQVNINMPKGATLTQMDQVVRRFERYLGQYSRKLDVFTSYVNNANNAKISISFKKAYENHLPYALKQSLESLAVNEGAADFAIYGVGRGFSNAINFDNFDSSISLKGYNYQQLKTLALRVKDSLTKIPRVQSILISTQERYNLMPTQEYQVKIDDPKQLYLHNSRKRDIGYALNQSNESVVDLGAVSSVSGEPMDVRLYHNRNAPSGIWDLMNTQLQLNDSAILRMANMASIEPVTTTDDIVRKNQEYILNVHYRFIGTYKLNRLITERLIEDFNKVLPFGYSIYSTGYDDWWDTESNSHLWLIVLVLFIIFIICAALLESFVQPFAVISMIPFSFIGVFLVYHLLELRFDQGAYAALLMVSSLITNTALYIINDLNFFKRSRSRQIDAIEVYARALNAKAMPIIVTTVAAILSMLPFMYSGEEQGFWYTLSAGTIGGLLFSLIGAYVLLPLCLIKNRNKQFHGEVSNT